MIGQAFRQLIWLAVLALLPAVVHGFIELKLKDPPPTKEGEIEIAQVMTWGDKVQWVDARSKAKFDVEHIPGAVPLNEDHWNALVPAFLDAWEPEIPVVIYCDGGGCEASHAVAKRLKEELKIENVWVLKGGWDSWRRK